MRFLLSFLTLSALLISSCGGGGGGGDSSDSGNNIANITPSSIAISRDTSQTALGTQEIVFRITDYNDDVFIGVYFSENGIENVTYELLSDSAEIEISFKPNYTLDPGTYYDEVYVVACKDEECNEEFSNSPYVVPIEYTVTTYLKTDLDRLTFNTTTNDSTPASSQDVYISGSSSNWEATPNQDWIILNKTSGTTPDTISVSLDTDGLEAGAYIGSFTLTPDGNNNYSRIVLVELEISDNRLFIGDPGIAFIDLPSISTLAAEIFVSDTQGLNTIDWTASCDKPWITYTVSGTTDESLAIEADPAGLTHNQVHRATVTVSSNDPTIQNSQTIEIGLWISSSDTNNLTLRSSSTHMQPDPIRPYLYLHDGGDQINIRNTYTGNVVSTIDLPDSQLGSMITSHDGKTLFVFDEFNHTLVSIDLDTHTKSTDWYSVVNVMSLAYMRPEGIPTVFASTGTTLFGYPIGSQTRISTYIDLHDYIDTSLSNNLICGTETGLSPNSVSCYRVNLAYNNNNLGFSLTNVFAGNIGSYGRDIAVSPDGSKVYVASGSPYIFSVIRITNEGTSIYQLNGSSYPNNVDVADSGAFVGGVSTYSGSTDIWTYDENNTPLNSFRLTNDDNTLEDRQLYWSGDGNRIFVLTQYSDQLYIYSP